MELPRFSGISESNLKCNHLLGAMENQDNPEDLAAQAERCRRLAGATYNREVSDILGSMAEQYQRAAQELSAQAPPSAAVPQSRA